MRRATAVAAVVLALLVLAALASAQRIPTGSLRGTVDDGTATLPGVTVSVTSPNLQGVRTTTSSVNGDYFLDLLPPGEYAVGFALDGFQGLDTTVRVSANQSSTVDATLPQVTTVTEEVSVTGSNETISSSAPAARTYEAGLIEALPVARGAFNYVVLSPGTVVVTGTSLVLIAGGISQESLFLVNGAAASDNLYGGMLPVYIEDAIQEVTTTVNGASAEYGRFTGGVITMLTRSGGNELHGSLRLNLTNPEWTAKTPLTVTRADELGKIWEGTLGGYVLKDRLWYFLGGRTTSVTTSTQTYQPVSIPVDQTTRENRLEAKLTWAITPEHRLTASYLGVQNRQYDWYFTNYRVYDLDSFYDRSMPQDIQVANYAGVLSDTFFVEGQYSARHLAFEDFGSRYTDIERGTPVWDLTANAYYNSPLFCAVCPDATETRSIEDVFAKGSAFLPSGKLGSHDLRLGLDAFDDMRRSNNWQSGSSYIFNAASVIIQGTGTTARYFPVVEPGVSFIKYYPIPKMSQGSHLKTYSAFVHDTWRLDSHLTFDVGLRYDSNDGTDSSGVTVTKDSRWSPRLAVSWDPAGDGAWLLTAGYGQYVATVSQSVAPSSAGTPAWYYLNYQGPAINLNGPEVETGEALRRVFAWLEEIGGVLANPQLWTEVWVPGYQAFLGEDLRSPAATAWTLSTTRRLGSKGLVRLDLVDKTWSDFYADRCDTTTGKSEDPVGNVYDRHLVVNNTDLVRRYRALMLQGDVRLGERLRLGGNYTLSRLWGNDPATTMRGIVGIESYPEYRTNQFGNEGDLGGDRRHTLNAYASWDAVSSRTLSLNLSLLQLLQTGYPYGASGQVVIRPYVTNPGYATPPQISSYRFTARDAYRTDTVTSTDLAATFSVRLWKTIEVYLNPQVRNVFNEQAVIGVNASVRTAATNPKSFARFNPFTDTPKECPQGATCTLADAYNWQKGPSFGQPTDPSHYQTPRTFLLNVGLRF